MVFFFCEYRWHYKCLTAAVLVMPSEWGWFVAIYRWEHLQLMLPLDGVQVHQAFGCVSISERVSMSVNVNVSVRWVIKSSAAAAAALH